MPGRVDKTWDERALLDIDDLTDSSGGTADGTVEAVSGSGADAAINNNFAEMATRINELYERLRRAT